MSTSPRSPQDPTRKRPPHGFRWEELEIFGPILPNPDPSLPSLHAKHPWLSLLASVVLPGLGTYLNGEPRKGILIMVSYLLAFLFVLATARELVGLVFVPFLLYLYVINLLDAYSGAKKWNRRHHFFDS